MIANHEIPAEFIAWRCKFIKMVGSSLYNKYILLEHVIIPVSDVYILNF